MKERILALLKKDHTLFLLSNVVYSASTYFVMLLVPYILTLKQMADFSSVYNVLLLMMMIFEFGLSVSFLRFHQIYKVIQLINAFSLSTVFIILLIVFYTPLNSLMISFFDLNTLDFNLTLFFISLIVQLGWTFAKNIMLTQQRFRSIFVYSVLTLLIRIGGLIYFYYAHLEGAEITLNFILLYMFILPFFFTPLILAAYIVQIFRTYRNHVINIRRYKSIFLHYLKRFIRFSLLSYFIGMLYIFAGRYLILYLTEQSQTSLLADLGYAMTFLGIMTIASASFRTYFVSKFHLGDMESIRTHLSTFSQHLKTYTISILFISAFISLMVYIVMPSYLSIRSPIFVFIMLFSYGIIFFLSLITFLARTMSYNRLEIGINAFRLIATIIIARTIFIPYPILGFILINTILLLAEMYFAYVILKKIAR